eukprot:CAMPEP_0198276000 /NCGR_PEP_ID=MMETSP1447-20131203/65076_1 /TAXON_ID=420782 /ORGANISM="Chaetoceros dichaeta, Strain CCMP1751" /LENGTH=475 /DNA_ID=CAMNT_0043970915 /DNA_START=102 /DNA_END=1526 /DNA_ORIENTATION=-
MTTNRYYNGDPGVQFLIQTPFGKGLVIRTRQSQTQQTNSTDKTSTKQDEADESSSAVSSASSAPSSNPVVTAEEIKEVRLLEWENAVNATTGGSSNIGEVRSRYMSNTNKPKKGTMMYTTTDYESVEIKQGSDVVTPFGRGKVLNTVAVRIRSKGVDITNDDDDSDCHRNGSGVTDADTRMEQESCGSTSSKKDDTTSKDNALVTTQPLVEEELSNGTTQIQTIITASQEDTKEDHLTTTPSTAATTTTVTDLTKQDDTLVEEELSNGTTQIQTIITASQEDTKEDHLTTTPPPTTTTTTTTVTDLTKQDDTTSTTSDSSIPQHQNQIQNQKERVLTKYQIELTSWRLAGRSTVKCYLFQPSHPTPAPTPTSPTSPPSTITTPPPTQTVRAIRPKTLSEMSPHEKVHLALHQKQKASLSFATRSFPAALHLYASAVDAVRYVQHDSQSTNECRADLIDVMVTCSNNAATCCVQLG